MNIVSTFIFTPGMAVHCAKSGPIAWDGVLAFWIPAVSFAIQFILNGWYLVRAVRTNLESENGAEAMASFHLTTSDSMAMGGNCVLSGRDSKQQP